VIVRERSSVPTQGDGGDAEGGGGGGIGFGGFGKFFGFGRAAAALDTNKVELITCEDEDDDGDSDGDGEGTDADMDVDTEADETGGGTSKGDAPQMSPEEAEALRRSRLLATQTDGVPSAESECSSVTNSKTRSKCKLTPPPGFEAANVATSHALAFEASANNNTAATDEDDEDHDDDDDDDGAHGFGHGKGAEHAPASDARQHQANDSVGHSGGAVGIPTQQPKSSALSAPPSTSGNKGGGGGGGGGGTSGASPSSSRETDPEVADPDSDPRSFTTFSLNIVHRLNRTGFEEHKEFPVRLGSVVAGRYQLMAGRGARGTRTRCARL
jgi:hypothetical protein